MQQHVFTIARVCRSFGIEHAVISPGSRSAPLVLAFLRELAIRCHVMADERSAAFTALGMAQQYRKPVVLICTSGTALANYFPAVAEAYYQRIPLLILSADRPPELLNQQDGQMIMQKGIFGRHVLGSHELMCFEEDLVDHSLTERIVLQALEESMSESGFGPVHINVPLREPLYNLQEPEPITDKVISNRNVLSNSALRLPKIHEFSDAWRKAQRKLIIAGQMPPSKNLNYLLNAFINQDDVVLIADVASNLHDSSNAPLFDTILQQLKDQERNALRPDFILSFGGPLVSKSLKTWLKSQKPEWHFRIDANSNVIDTYNNLTDPLHASLQPYLEALLSMNIFKGPGNKPFADLWRNLNAHTAKRIRDFHAQQIWCEPTVVFHLLNKIPDNSQLQVSNSSPVRWVSWNGIPNKALQIFCNRGTSGIDGSISTAVGAANARPHQMVTLLTGDMSLIYDEHAFWQSELPSNLRVVVLNNCGGNIFNWIEGPSSHPGALPYFTTPHQRNIESLANGYGLGYLKADDFKNFHEALNKLFQPSKKPVLLEVNLSGEDNSKGISAFRRL